MELTTLGTALKFAMELESTAMEVFDAAAEAESSLDRKSLFADLSASSADRKAKVEKLYNENIYSDMDTGIFEPLQPMSGGAYAVRPESSVTTPAFIIESIEMERKSGQFYSDLAAQFKTRRRSIAKGLEKMAADNGNRKKRLEMLKHL